MANKTTKNMLSATLFAGVGLGICYIFVRHRHTIYRKIQSILDFRNPLRHQHIEIITNTEECRQVIAKIKTHCKEYNILGFDCEWVTLNGTRRPVALLQLATHRGLCALFRLCSMRRIPRELKDILEDYDIIKVGVVPLNDANYLYHDYAVSVTSTLDLRHLAFLANARTEGLAKMAKTHLNINLNKNWRLSCSDWESPVLNELQIKYAANDAHVAVKLFQIFIEKIEMYQNDDEKKNNQKTAVYEQFLDSKFNPSRTSNCSTKMETKKLLSPKIQPNRFISTRATPLYDNCFLQAPDGEILCTCDRRKATWYVKNNLGIVIQTDSPYTVRLNFEPAGRAVGDVGKFYQQPKENRCVSCGITNSIIRKNVIPLEYRKHFPDVMKSHMSHDVLLLCASCHQKSNISDLSMRKQLAALCKAPLEATNEMAKMLEKPHLKRLKSAARALYSQIDKIPEKRIKALRKEVLKHYSPGTEITENLLHEASNMSTFELNQNYISHGEQVVQFFKKPKNGGLITLERLWRKHFLNIMNPKYLPELWSVEHNAERLEIRAEEGRIAQDDLILAGIKEHCKRLSTDAAEDSFDQQQHRNSNTQLTDSSLTSHCSLVDDGMGIALIGDCKPILSSNGDHQLATPITEDNFIINTE